MEARLAVVAAETVPLEPVVPACGVALLDELGLLDVLGPLDGFVPADAVGGGLAFTLVLVLGGVTAAAGVWAATVVAPGATPTATGAGELPVEASSVARGGEVEPPAPTAPAACGARLEPVSAASTRLERSADRAVIDRAPGATVPRETGLALEAASA